MQIRRALTLLAAAVIIFMGVGGNKLLSAKKEAPKRNPAQGLKSVQVRNVSNGAVEAAIPLTGPLVSTEKIEVVAEVTGKLLPGNKRFQEGVRFRKGEALLRIDDTDQRLNLVSQRSTFHSGLIRLLPDLKIDYGSFFEPWETYVNRFSAEQPLPEPPEVSDQKLRNFLSVNGVYNSYHSIKSMEAQLAKFTVYAPFSGVVSQGNLDPGSLVRAGMKVGEFLDPDVFEMEASVNLDDLEYLRTGQAVRLSSEGTDAEFQGTVRRISEAVDPMTQTVKVYVRVRGEGLREGLYLSGAIGGTEIANAVQIPRKLVMEDRFVWVLEDSLLAQRDIEVIHGFSDQVAVRGLKNGEVIVDQVLPSAYAGMRIRPNRAEAAQ